MGELVRPGERGPRLPLPAPGRDLVRPPRPPAAARVVLRCGLCGAVFSDPLLALAHQEEHAARGERPCFVIVEAR